MTQRSKKRFTWPLMGLLLLIILIIWGFLYFDKITSVPIKIDNIKIDTKAALKLDVLSQISKKNGITEWELTASSATLLKKENRAELADVSIFFYTKDSKKVHLKSKQGVLNTKTHDMVFSGDVIITFETSVLRTDKLQYKKKEHIIHTDLHITLEKADSIIEADSMTTLLNEGTTILEGHVKGTFSENFDIK
jgi:LPS export ABC transporter protein LptC